MAQAKQSTRQIGIGTPLGEDVLLLRGFTFTEHLGRPFEMTADLASEQEVDFDQIVGQNVTVRVHLAKSGEMRYFNGIVSRFSQTGGSVKRHLYSATVVPWLWLLTRTSDCKIYQNKKVPDIIKEVFRLFGLTDFEDRLTKSYSTWEYCVQYQETHFNFVSRLMEQEGIYYYFEHDNGSHKMILCDSMSAHEPYKDYSSIKYHVSDKGVRKEEHISRFWVTQEVQSGKYVHTDYDFTAPKKDLKTDAKIKRQHAVPDMEIFEYPGEYDQVGDGRDWARVRIEELQTPFEIASGEGDCRGIHTGCKFALAEYPREDLNKDYVVTSTEYSAWVSEYESAPVTAASRAMTAAAAAQHGPGIAMPARPGMSTGAAAAAGHTPGGGPGLAPGSLGAATQARTPSGMPAMGPGVTGVGTPSHIAGAAAAGAPGGIAAMGMAAYTQQMAAPGELTTVTKFNAIDFNNQFRPARSTPKPQIPGPQTAIVVGTSGEEIDTDKYARVKLHFHWDRYSKADQNSSCWVRVAQVWAGKKWGAMYIPRIGQEVVVEFLEGDPDQPLVTGRVYNDKEMPPYDLPGEKTKSTLKSNTTKGGDGFNEIRFEDKQGKEQVFIHAQKDMDERVKNDSKEWIGNDRHLIVKKKQYELVEEDKHLHIKKNHHEKIDEDMHLHVVGNENIKVDKTISRQAGTDVQEKAGSNYAMEAGQEIHLKGGMKVIIEAGVQLTIKASGGFVDIGPAGVTIQGTMVLINSGGAAGSGSGSSPTSPTDPTDAKEADNAKTGNASQPPSPRTGPEMAQLAGGGANVGAFQK